jgi:D-arabinose 1-dehydrogenase-like Zn-dependent alcohol dehydrogenase
MRAVVLRAVGGLENLEVEDRPIPAPRPNEVLVQVRAAAVCHRDLLDRRGAFPFLRTPVVTGHEFAGIVVALGDEVTEVRRGDRVTAVHRPPCDACPACRAGEETHCRGTWQAFGLTIDGCYAEYLIAPAAALVTLPDGLDFAAAAPLMCTAGVARRALFRVGKLQPGETLLLTGASGGVGHMALQLARRAGARVLAVTSNPAKVDALRAAGADEVIVSTDGRFQGDVLGRTEGQGADMALECVGAPMFQASLRSLAPGGRLVLVGNVTAGKVELNPGQVILHERRILGSDSATRAELREVLEMAARGEIAIQIARRLPLGQASEAQALLEARAVVGRVILEP